ncbi:MAG: tetratricopeptide repeat protein [Methanotrichaceae archaeon]|nr:tetratricopeptide repeat protein [Methanotrichaceae archaeon]
MNTTEKVLLHKGIDKAKRMQYQEALEIFEKVISMNDQIPEAWNNKGVALFSLDRFDESLECYDRSLAIDPLNIDALRNKGFVLLNVGQLEEALECYNTVILNSGDILDMEAKATALAGLGRTQEALDCLMEAAKIRPLGRFEEEIEILKNMIDQDQAR